MMLKPIYDIYNFSEAEKNFMMEAHTATTAEMNQSRIVSELLLGKKINEFSDKLIQSNKELAVSNDKHSHRMLQFTFTLVFVGFVQIIVNILK